MPASDRQKNNKNSQSRPTEPAGFPARRAALKMLDAVTRRGDALDLASNAACQGIKNPSDRALAMVIASETLRWMRPLDALIDSATRQRLPDDAKARMVLRIALVQALKLGTPGHAAIATALPLVHGGPKRLVHGVFGTLMRGQATLPQSPALPDTVASRWQDIWGKDVVEAASHGWAEPPPLDITLKDPARTENWSEKLEGRSLMPGHVRIPRGRAVETLPGFDDGAWWIQDLAASLPARLLGSGDGRHVLDLCAAPGGKAMQLAAAGWKVTAIDVSEKRLVRVRENADRCGLAIGTLAADIMQYEPPEPVDAILLDAPCSASGIFRRHPDTLYRTNAHQIADLAETQRAMLEHVRGWLKPGGTMVYATCSLEPAEGEDQAVCMLEDGGLEILPVDSGEMPPGLIPTGQGYLRTVPGMLAEHGGLDGFFAARFRRI